MCGDALGRTEDRSRFPGRGDGSCFTFWGLLERRGVDLHQILVGELDAVHFEEDAHGGPGVLGKGGEFLGGDAVVGHLQVVHPAGLLEVNQGGDEVHGFLGVLLAHGLGHVDEPVVEGGAVLHHVGVVGPGDHDEARSVGDLRVIGGQRVLHGVLGAQVVHAHDHARQAAAEGHLLPGGHVLAVLTGPGQVPAHGLDGPEGQHIPHEVVPFPILTVPHVQENPSDRCYYCKHALFARMKELAEARGIAYVVDGSNLDDDGDYRPGHRALHELGIVSPLHDAGFRKQDIRDLSQALGLPTWNKPSFACLASRFPYGEQLTPAGLARVNAAEEYLMAQGFTQFRVRDHGAGTIARIEVPPADIGRLLDPALRAELTARFRELGYQYVTVDLQGYMPAKTGLQSVKAKVSLAMLGDSASSIAYTLSEDALVKVEKSSDPVLKLKSDTVTVTNSTDTGAVFDPATYIAAISDDSGVLPALKISSNVDTAADGNYFVSYTAVDNEGNSTNAVLNVTVKTPQEILDARAEAEAQAQKEAEDAEKKKQEEEQKQKEEALKKAQEEAEAAAAAQGDTSVAEKQYGTSGANPYPGGWSNCTYGAWEATYESTGVSLPNWGNAWNWLGNASASGYSTGRTPAAGSVAVYSHHVAYVDAVSADGTAVHIVEGGFNGHYNSRWVSPNGTGTQGLQGYIYIN